MSNDSTPKQFSSVDELLQNVQAAQNANATSEKAPQEDPILVDAPDQVCANEVEPDPVRLNQNDTVADVPPLTPVVKNEPEAATETVTPVQQNTPVFTNPSIEATIAEDNVKAKKDGSFIELENSLVNLMRRLRDERAGSNSQAEKVKEALNLLTFDINNLSIDSSANSNPIVVQQQLTILDSVKPVSSFPVIALKSGYRLTLNALNNNEKLQIRNFKGSIYDQTQSLIRLIYSKISETSVGTIKYDDFLKITAEDDWDTIVYGLYYATFPSDIEYTVGCPHCGQENNIKLCPDHLIEVVDQERAGQYVQEVLNGYERGQEFLKNSLVAKTSRKQLPDSKVIIDVGTATLRKLLDNLRLADQLKTYEPELVALIKSIPAIYVPNVQAASEGRATFFAITNPLEIINIVVGLSGKDMAELRNAVSERMRQYRVQYRIPSFTCAGSTCNKSIESISIDLTQLFFYAIGVEQQG